MQNVQMVAFTSLASLEVTRIEVGRIPDMAIGYFDIEDDANVEIHHFFNADKFAEATDGEGLQIVAAGTITHEPGEMAKWAGGEILATEETQDNYTYIDMFGNVKTRTHDDATEAKIISPPGLEIPTALQEASGKNVIIMFFSDME